MKGVIFKHFESFVSENYGNAVYEEILSSTTLETAGPFVGPATYPDTDFFSLVFVAISKLELPLPDALQAFGEYLFDHIARSVPASLRPPTGLRSFLMTVDSVIHVEVRKLFPDAATPKFQYTEPTPTSLALQYSSHRDLCDLALGLIRGAAASYGEAITVEKTLCTHNGDECCEFHIKFDDAALAAN